jgi:hypothetical protein
MAGDLERLNALASAARRQGEILQHLAIREPWPDDVPVPACCGLFPSCPRAR